MQKLNCNMMIDIMNVIRSNGSQEYQDRIPQATRDNIAAVGNPIINYQPFMNEFISSLMNRIVKVIVHNDMWKNPLKLLKGEAVPLGTDIQEIFTNMAKATTYDGSGTAMLQRTIPDTKVIYHRLNRTDQYPQTINETYLAHAFTTWDNLTSFTQSIITSLYTADEYDEFILTKNLLAQEINAEHVNIVPVYPVSDPVTGNMFVKLIKTYMNYFKFPSADFNSYQKLNPTDTKPVVTWTPIEDIILIIRADVLATLDVDVLARAFNLTYVQFMGQVLEVDNFGSASNTIAVLCDKAFFRIHDTKFEMTSFFNPQGLYTNYWLNHHQILSTSCLANCVAFNDYVGVESIEGTFPTTAIAGVNLYLLQPDNKVMPENATFQKIFYRKAADDNSGATVSVVINDLCQWVMTSNNPNDIGKTVKLEAYVPKGIQNADGSYSDFVKPFTVNIVSP